MDPRYEMRMAERAVHLANAIEGDLIRSASTPGPLQLILVRAKNRAAQALLDLVHVDPHDWKAVQRLQNEVTTFKDIVKYVSDALNYGDEQNRKITEDERLDLTEMLEINESEED